MLGVRLIFLSLFPASATPYCGFTHHYNWCRNEAVESDRSVREVRWRKGETPLSVKAVQGCLLSCVGVNGIFFMMLWEYEMKMSVGGHSVTCANPQAV